MPTDLDELAGPDSKEGHRLARYWRDLLEQITDDKEHKRWIKRGESIEKRYRDERNRVDEEGHRRYNSLWANVEILYPALYGRCPVPVAERRFRDKDPTGRSAAQILERALRNEIEICGFDESMRQAVRDYLLPGRGVVWVRYEPEIEEGVSLPVENKVDLKDSQGWIEEPGSEDDENDEHLRDTGDRVVRESTPVDFVQWQDFRTFPARARSWAEITAVAKRVHMSRSQMIKRFGKEIGEAIPLKRDERGQRHQQTSGVEQSDADKGVVWEIWSRDDRHVYWVAEDYEHLCDRKDDPLKLEHFFPCPRPLYANPTNTTLVPVPDFLQYQDQALQVDELTQRIALLTKACKVAGVYNAAAKSIQRLFNESVENELIPVDDWAAFSEKGGVEGNISFVPLKEIMGVLQELMVCKEKQVEEMDRLTGINDIMRGTSDARETLGGVRLKANNTGTRLTHRQNEVARFARDTVRIMADIMAQHFSPQSMIEASGALYEEGLGPSDMPALSTFDQMASQQPLKPTGGPGMPGSAPTPVPPNMMGAGPPPGMGQNVVPFKPPGASPLPPGAPPVGQAPLNGQVLPPMPAPPPVPPELMAQFQAMQRIAKAMVLLRDERLRGFRVDIEVDSTIFGDFDKEKEDRTQFIETVTGFLEKSMMMGAQVPEMLPLLGKFLQFGVRGFRVGRDLEAAIEQFCDESVGIAQKHATAAAQQQNPEMFKLEAVKVKSAADIQNTQMRSEVDKLKAQSDIQGVLADTQTRRMEAQAEVQRQQIENQGEALNSAADMQDKQIQMAMDQLEAAAERESKEFELKMQKISERIEKIKLKAAEIKANADIKAARQKSKEASKTAS